MQFHMSNCSERTGAYQLSEIMLERLEDVKMNTLHELRLFSHLFFVFGFELITVPNNTFRNTELTSWIGKRVLISVLMPSNLLT